MRNQRLPGDRLRWHTLSIGARAKTPPDEPVDAAWSALTPRWDDMAAHESFILLARDLEELPEAARRYKERESDPRFAAGSREALELLLSVTMAQLGAVPTTERPPKGLLWVPLLALLALMGLTLLASYSLGRKTLKTPVVLACEVALVALVPWRRVLSKR